MIAGERPPSSLVQTERPSTSSGSRPRNYDRPWMSQSMTFDRKPTQVGRPDNNLDLGIQSRKATFQNAMKSADTAKIDTEVKKISQTASKKIITQGKRQVREESEEIKLDIRIAQPSAPKPKVDVKAQVESSRSKKNAPTGKPTTTVAANPLNKVTKQVTINQAHEVPTPNEVAIAENPYDLQMEGVKVTETELKRHAGMNKPNPTQNYPPVRAPSARHSKTQSDIDLENFLSTQQKYASPAMSQRSEFSQFSISNLETKEWKFALN
ncbi:Oidioi.mRNA.OKI2018_I69.PAR.g11833.t1.cds [Oikopleura dioica]|uniref:Oidioi.mRNA.OKI2018_I69.PAR.g11833.t1.cds n=1 Tax=Oikopleura dioica TaxID=34765 RepID=A0ABN7RY68_OIKDI|nr:Oidioi.mRNA.OKI2018_I69.PAR.g11833.t1.cds [Oikopleura dioica]